MPSGKFDGTNRDYYFQVGVAFPCKRDRRWLERNIGTFLRQYARKAPRGKEPNDRRYDRKVEATTKRLRPQELDLLMHGEPADRETR
jgi:hypothetical protein